MLSEINMKTFGKVMGVDEPEMESKTDEQIAAEKAAEEDARQQKMKTEREKIQRQRGATGRAQLTYKGPQSVATQQDKLGAN